MMLGKWFRDILIQALERSIRLIMEELIKQQIRILSRRLLIRIESMILKVGCIIIERDIMTLL